MSKNYGVSITLDEAKRLAKDAEVKALEIGVPMVISIVDTGGNPVLTCRMDDAILVSIDVAFSKAFTSIAIKLPTHIVGPLIQPGAELYTLQNGNNNRIVGFGGGYPLETDNGIIGAIGISGGSVEQDMIVAEYALKKFNR